MYGRTLQVHQGRWEQIIFSSVARAAGVPKTDEQKCVLKCLCRVAARKSAFSRLDFNDFVWNRVLDRSSSEMHLGSIMRFQQMDNSSTLDQILMERVRKARKCGNYQNPLQSEPPQSSKLEAFVSKENHPLSKDVGLDPGKRNVATMIDSDGITSSSKAGYSDSERS